MSLIALFFVSFLNGQAQSVEWGSELVDVMYIGINNVLPLKYEGIDAADVQVEVSKGNLEKNDKGNYVWTHSVPGFQTISCKTDEKEVGTFRMKFVRLPDPIAEIYPKNATVKSFSALKCTLPGVKLNFLSIIQSYEIQITLNDDVTILKNKGEALTDANRRALKYVHSTATITLTDIKARCAGDRAGRRLGNVVLQ